MPEVQKSLANPVALEWLNYVGNFSILLYLLEMGTHIKFGNLHSSTGYTHKDFLVITLTSSFLPLAIGTLVGVLLVNIFPQMLVGEGQKAPLLTAAFIGLALTVSALAVMGSVLRERNRINSPYGQFCLKIGTAHEIVVWITVAIISSLLPHSEGHSTNPIVTLILAGIFCGAMFGLKLKVFGKISESKFWKELKEVKQLAFLITLGLAASVITETLGIHYAFGPIFFGAMLPEKEKILLSNAISKMAQSFLLNIYFVAAILPLKVDYSKKEIFIIATILILVAYLLQVIGTGLVLHLRKKSWEEALIVSFNLTIKGVVEIVVASSFLGVGLITPELFGVIIFLPIATAGLNTMLCNALEKRIELKSSLPEVLPS